MSESEAEDAAGEEVTLPQDLPGAGNIKQQQSAVKLTEVLHLYALYLTEGNSEKNCGSGHLR